MKKMLSRLVLLAMVIAAMVFCAACSDVAVYNIKVVNGDGYEILPAKGYENFSVINGEFEFAIEIKDGYIADDLKVFANDTLLENNQDNYFVVKNITTDIVIKAEGIKKLETDENEQGNGENNNDTDNGDDDDGNNNIVPPAPTDPEPTNPKPTDPDPTDPDPTDPEPTDPDPTDPEPTDPEPTDPDPTDPEPTDPEPTDPEPTDPDPTDPEPTDPDPTDPEPTDPEPTDPDPTDPEPTDPDPTDPEPPVTPKAEISFPANPIGYTITDENGLAFSENMLAVDVDTEITFIVTVLNGHEGVPMFNDIAGILIESDSDNNTDFIGEYKFTITVTENITIEISGITEVEKVPTTIEVIEATLGYKVILYYKPSTIVNDNPVGENIIVSEGNIITGDTVSFKITKDGCSSADYIDGNSVYIIIDAGTEFEKVYSNKEILDLIDSDGYITVADIAKSITITGTKPK